MLSDKVTVLFIPQEGSKTFELKVPKVVIALGGIGIVVVVSLLVIGIFSYFKARSLEAELGYLEREKDQLVAQVGVIRQLGQDLSRLQRVNRQLHAILGESAGLEPVQDASTDSHSEGIYIAFVDRLRWGRLRSLPTIWPVRGSVLRPFGESRGTVIETASGQVVRASGSGWVVRADFDARLGNVITIDHGNGIVTDYGYNGLLLVGEGGYVDKGQPIALSGYSGEAPGPALFFAVRENGEYRDPLTYRLWM